MSWRLPAIFRTRGLPRSLSGPTPGLEACSRRTLEEAHGHEPGQGSEAKKRGRLPACERLGVFDQIVEVAGLDRVGNGFDLGCRLPDVPAGDWQVIVEPAGGPAHRLRECADVFGAGALLL